MTLIWARNFKNLFCVEVVFFFSMEAGQPHLTDPKILTPGLCGTLSGDPEYDWKVKTVPQVNLSTQFSVILQ
jgi:hypothetical protein